MVLAVMLPSDEQHRYDDGHGVNTPGWTCGGGRSRSSPAWFMVLATVLHEMNSIVMMMMVMA
jgi:hypothetical protein